MTDVPARVTLLSLFRNGSRNDNPYRGPSVPCDRGRSVPALSQAANMYVNRPVFDIHVSSPDVIQQLLAAVNAFRMGHKEVQEFKFGRPHVEGFSPVITRCDVGSRLRPCISITSSTAIGEIRRMTALMRATSSFGEKGLVIVRAGLQTAHAILFLSARREHHHRMSRVSASRFRCLINCSPEPPGNIQSSRIRSGGVHSAGSPRCHNLPLQPAGSHFVRARSTPFHELSFIFYDQNTSRHTLPCLILFKLQVCNAAPLCVRFMTDL